MRAVMAAKLTQPPARMASNLDAVPAMRTNFRRNKHRAVLVRVFTDTVTIIKDAKKSEMENECSKRMS